MSMGPGAFKANAPELDVEAMERDLARIPAVTSARVVVENGELHEIHIVCGPGRSPKLINRDVQSLLAARWGVDIDHRKVSVVQLTDEDIDLTAEPAPAPAETPESAPARTAAPSTGVTARVLEISVSVSDDHCEASVTVGTGDRKATGRATGIPSLEGQRRVAAGAALVAMANLEPSLTPFGVSDVTSMNVANERIIITTICGWRDGAERTMVGASPVGTLGELRAAAEAVLRAVY
jgi:hypothetical protein